MPTRLIPAVIVLLAALVPGAHAETVTVNGIELYYQQAGSGEPLLLIHGGLGNGDYWREQIETFSRHFRVIAPDSRGHGRSSFDARPIGYALMASDMLALLDQLGVESAHVVGWSDGGIIGLELAVRHRERVRRVVAYGANYNPAGVRTDIGENARFNSYIERAAADYQSLSPAPGRWQEFLDNIGAMWAREPNFSAAELGAITTPILVLDGAEEEAIYVEHVKDMAALIPRSRLIIMPGTGHFAMWDQPAEFDRIVLEFLGASAE